MTHSLRLRSKVEDERWGLWPGRGVTLHLAHLPPRMRGLGSKIISEGTCQVGQVNFNFYLPDIILTCPAKGVIE